jgi:hypothetical protein
MYIRSHFPDQTRILKGRLDTAIEASTEVAEKPVGKLKKTVCKHLPICQEVNAIIDGRYLIRQSSGQPACPKEI